MTEKAEMLYSKPLSKVEIQEIYETSITGLVRAKIRVLYLLGLAAILVPIYPFKIILVWVFFIMVLEFLNYWLERHIVDMKDKNIAINAAKLYQYFIISWAESLSIVVLAIALSVQEGQIPHFLPYLILVCTSIYIATSTFQNATLMIGHLALYNIALIFIATRDVFLSYPDTGPTLWVQFLAAIIIALFLLDNYIFFHRIYLDGRKKSKELGRARKQAEKLTQQKSDLISALGHELRTPLTGILGFSQVMKLTKLSKKQMEYVNLVERSGQDLQRLLSNILDSETLELGLLHLHPVATDVAALLHRTLKIFEFSAGRKEIYLKLEIAEGFPDKIVIDEIRLGQCLTNLLANAVRHTKTGGVIIRADFINNNNPKLKIAVYDTGSGIPRDQTEEIFDKFSKVENQNHPQGGTGLGLWLVHSIAKAMNGHLSLTDTSSKGSRFLLVFNVEVQDATQPTDISSLVDKRILYIEDTVTNQILVRFLLEEQGVILSEANTGQEALRLLNSADYDVILCDLQLPDCSGNDLLGKIRALNRNAHIPIIALTAQPENAKTPPHTPGFQAILSKPVNQPLLVSTLKQVLAKPG